MTTPPTITIPKLENETPRAYAARVEYLTMGAGRSLDRVAGQKGGKSGGRINNTTVENWSVKYGWAARATEYDATLATLAAQAHAEQYRRDLDEHRQRYQKAGRDLHAIAQGLLAQCARAVRGEVVRTTDGREITIPAMELTPAALSTAMRALMVAADLEAHALRVADLLPRLGADSERD